MESVASSVFLSYAREDYSYAQKLARFLEGHGIQVWWDFKLVAGEVWARTIQQRINSCDNFLVVLTPEASQSTWVHRELSYAANRNKPIFPLLLDECDDPPMIVIDMHQEDVRGGRMPGSRIVQLLGGKPRRDGHKLRRSRHTKISHVRPFRTPLSGHVNGAQALAFNPRGDILATGSGDGIIRLWDSAENEDPFRVLPGHTKKVTAISFAPDGTCSATGGMDGTVRLWDTASGHEIHSLVSEHELGVYAVAFSPDGTVLATGGGGQFLRFWDPNTGQQAREPITAHEFSINDATFSPDGTLLATASNDSTVGLWDPATGRLIHRLSGHEDAVCSVSFSPDNSVLATTDCHGVRLWDSDKGGQIAHLRPDYEDMADEYGWYALAADEPKDVSPARFSPDGTLLAAVDLDGIVILWDFPGLEQLGMFKAHASMISDLAFHPDGSVLATAGHDRTVRLWELMG